MNTVLCLVCTAGYIVMAYMVMAYVVMAYVVMAYEVMAYRVMAHSKAYARFCASFAEQVI